MESLLLDIDEGAGSLDPFVMVAELSPTLFVSQPSLPWASEMCVHGVFDLGCILVNHRLYTLTPSMRVCPLPHSTPSACPHTKLSASISSYLLCPLRPLPSGCLVFSLAFLIRFTFAMLLADPLCHAPQTCVINPVLYLSHIHPPCFVFFLLVCSFPQKTLNLLEIFSPSNSLNFDTSSQVVDKNGESKSGSLPSSIVIGVAVPPWTVYRLIPVSLFAWNVS